MTATKLGLHEGLADYVGERTQSVLDHRRRTSHGRGWVMRRALLAADATGLLIAFVTVEVLYERTTSGLLSSLGSLGEYVVFLATLPLWLVGATFFGLYASDEERADHSTADDLMRVFLLVTVGAFLFTRIGLVTDQVSPHVEKMTVFWGLAIALMTVGRIVARALARRSMSYVQNALVIGAGDVGQLVARKLLRHSEYGINVVGFVDDNPRERRADLGDLIVLGGIDDLADLVSALHIDRAIVSFSGTSDSRLVEALRTLRKLDVQIDILPRLFELVGPNANVHSVEALPLLGLPPARIPRSSRILKRSLDIVVSLPALVVTAPLILFIAWRIKRDSPGPVLFRQQRLGIDMKEFTLLKFRTMTISADQDAHREFIKATMTHKAFPQANGLYKLERSAEITKVGSLLRRTSLDELPQLINVLRGDMSLVGPRPCLRYETEHFAPHHFDRFLVPAGITGLWQVTARARSTFGEALDMDVAYARSWSLGLDLRLLCRTPLHALRATR